MSEKISFHYFLEISLITFLLYLFFYYITFIIDPFLSSFLDTKSNYLLPASLLFLPHGIRVLATMMWGNKIYPALFIAQVCAGSYATGSHYVELFILSFLSLLPFPIVYYFLFKSLDEDEIQSHINLKNVCIVAIATSCLSGIFSTIYKHILNPQTISNFFNESLHFVIGDIAGSVIIFALFILLYDKIRLGN